MASLTVRASRPVACRPAVAGPRPRLTARLAAQQPRRVLVRAEPRDVETAISEAKQTCEEGTTGECAAAWDEVEEISAHLAHKKAAGSNDPLEKYCEDNPETDECRVYED